MARQTEIPIGGARPRLTPTTAVAGLLVALALAATVAAWPGGVAGAKSTSTTTTTRARATTTTASTSGASPADRWLVEAIGHEARIGSVHIDGKVTQGKSTIYLDLEVNGDGEGGGTFIENGYSIQIERVGPILYFNAPKAFWEKSAPKAQAEKYGGRWLEFAAVDSRFISFDQFLDATDLVSAAFQGHTTPLTVGKPTTYQGHKVVIVKDTITGGGKRATGSMYISAKGPAVVYKIVDDSPGDVSTLVFTHYGKAITLSVPPNAINLT